jgi:ketosteroid isomerase-like protein
MLTAGCSKHESETNFAQEIQEVREADRALLQAETKRDLKAAMKYFSEDAVFQPPNSPPAIGKQAIKEFYIEFFDIPYIGIYCESDTVVISKSSDLAYLIGNSYYELKTADGAKRIDGKYMTIWRKIENKWLCVAVSWSGNKPFN